ncbi:MAG: hypothetical protein LBQ36_03575 [Synergistaceae bacterium]|jgi:hypothetical protein|nr:hypothetical protein [Synergistaceae bacterium]
MADSSSAKKPVVSSRSKQAPRGHQENNTKKMLGIIVMLLCCAASFYFYWTTMQVLRNNEDQLSQANMTIAAPDPEAEKEKKEIGDAEVGLKNLSVSSRQAMNTALLAETQSRYPLDLPITLTPTVTLPSGADIVIEPDPPFVTVVAIMITDSDRVAMLNIDGEEGVLVRQGSKFSNGTARITKIDAKGVTYTWMKKSIQVSL